MAFITTPEKTWYRMYDPYDMGLEKLVVGAAYQKIHTTGGDIYMKAYGLYET